jgi:signal transduction histidine kinase
VVAWLSNREIERSLRRARKSEHDLKEERDLLEVKVDERTHELQAAQLEKLDHLYRFAEFGQIASGLFHDLTSILNALALRADTTDQSLSKAFGVQAEIDEFVRAVRKQLSRENIQEYFSPRDIISQVMHLVSHKCQVDHINISFENEYSSLNYFGDPTRFHQVVINLVMNAIDSFKNFSNIPAGRKNIIIRLSKKKDHIVFEVEDNGCGIPRNIQDKIFESFFTTKSNGGGIGIGLAMTKRIVEKDFKGTITVESEEGVGARFIVRLPFENENQDKRNVSDNGDENNGHRNGADF